MAIEPVPSEHQNLIPYLVVEDVPRLLEFLHQALAAAIEHVAELPDDRLHAAVRVGDSLLMMGSSGAHCDPIPTNLYCYVPDADATWRAALAAGAESISEPKDEFYGDRVAGFRDPGGNTWWVGTRQEDVSAEELKQRVDALAGQPPGD